MGQQGWHAGSAALARYAAGSGSEVEAWSVEAHLAACALCRAELALAVQTGADDRAGQVRESLATGRQRLLATLPAQPAGVAARPARTAAAGAAAAHGGSSARRWRPWSQRAGRSVSRRHLGWALQPSALLAVAVATATAVLLVLVAADVATSTVSPGSDGQDDRAGALLWLLAPVLPLAGVALCSVGEDDPWKEVVVSTPVWGLRLVLWRVLAVLVVSLPLLVVAGLVVEVSPAGGTVSPVLGVVPCLALVALTLALGTVVRLQRAAVVVAAAWFLAVSVPAVLAGRGPAVVVDRLATAPSAAAAPLVAGPGALAAWAVVGVVAVVVLLRRGDRYSSPGAPAGAPS